MITIQDIKTAARGKYMVKDLKADGWGVEKNEN